MSDLVKRLRLDAMFDGLSGDDTQSTSRDAADRIEALEAALRQLCDAADSTKYPHRGPEFDRLWNCAVAARKTLGSAAINDLLKD